MSFGNSNHSIIVNPTVGESLVSFIDRCNLYSSQLEEWSSTHVSWWTHRSTGNCWICDLLHMNHVLCDVMKDIVSNSRDKFVAQHPKDSTNPEYFVFQRK